MAESCMSAFLQTVGILQRDGFPPTSSRHLLLRFQMVACRFVHGFLQLPLVYLGLYV